MAVCKNCGAVVDTTVLKCPYCGGELEVKDSKPLRELQNQIIKFEQLREEPKMNYNSSDISFPFLSYKESLNYAERMSKPSNVDVQIANIIQSFPIPSTREDILEFLAYAESNIIPEVYNVFSMTKSIREGRKLITQAWISKYEYAYNKAILAFQNDESLERIHKAFLKKQDEILRETRKGKRTFCMLMLGLFAIWLLCILLLFLI